MKKLLTILVVLSIISPVFAKIPTVKHNNLPQGTFKKKSNGNIVQYNDKGKKIATYKMINGRLVKIK